MRSSKDTQYFDATQSWYSYILKITNSFFSLSPVIKCLGQNIEIHCCKDIDKYEVFPRASHADSGHLRTSKIGSCVLAKLSSGTTLNKEIGKCVLSQ